MRSTLLVFLALSVLGAPPPAPGQDAPNEKRSSQPDGRDRPARGRRVPRWKDNELRKAIEERFDRSPISVNQFQVEVNNGVAHLSGETTIPQHKGTATRLAKTAGAKRVVNEIKVLTNLDRPSKSSSKAATEKRSRQARGPAR